MVFSNTQSLVSASRSVAKACASLLLIWPSGSIANYKKPNPLLEIVDPTAPRLPQNPTDDQRLDFALQTLWWSRDAHPAWNFDDRTSSVQPVERHLQYALRQLKSIPDSPVQKAAEEQRKARMTAAGKLVQDAITQGPNEAAKKALKSALLPTTLADDRMIARDAVRSAIAGQLRSYDFARWYKHPIQQQYSPQKDGPSMRSEWRPISELELARHEEEFVEAEKIRKEMLEEDERIRAIQDNERNEYRVREPKAINQVQRYREAIRHPSPRPQSSDVMGGRGGDSFEMNFGWPAQSPGTTRPPEFRYSITPMAPWHPPMLAPQHDQEEIQNGGPVQRRP